MPLVCIKAKSNRQTHMRISENQFEDRLFMGGWVGW